MGKFWVFFNPFAQFVAITNRHEDVGQDEIGIQIGNPPNSSLAVAHGSHFDSAALKRQRNHLLNVCVIVRNENSWHFQSLVARFDTCRSRRPSGISLDKHPEKTASTDR